MHRYGNLWERTEHRHPRCVPSSRQRLGYGGLRMRGCRPGTTLERLGPAHCLPVIGRCCSKKRRTTLGKRFLRYGSCGAWTRPRSRKTFALTISYSRFASSRRATVLSVVWSERPCLRPSSSVWAQYALTGRVNDRKFLEIVAAETPIACKKTIALYLCMGRNQEIRTHALALSAA